MLPPPSPAKPAGHPMVLFFPLELQGSSADPFMVPFASYTSTLTPTGVPIYFCLLVGYLEATLSLKVWVHAGHSVPDQMKVNTALLRGLLPDTHSLELGPRLIHKQSGSTLPHCTGNF